MKNIIKYFSIIFFVVIGISACNKDQNSISNNSRGLPVASPANYQNRPPIGGDDADCMVKHVNDSLPEGYQVVEVDVLYEFRDNFLSSTTTGQQYINFYYYLCIWSTENHLINSTNLLDVYRLLNYGVYVSDVIKNGQDSDIVINNEIYLFCKDLSDRMKNETNYNEVSDIFEILDEDLEELKGKTKSEFIDSFNE